MVWIIEAIIPSQDRILALRDGDTLLTWENHSDCLDYFLSDDVQEVTDNALVGFVRVRSVTAEEAKVIDQAMRDWDEPGGQDA
jgi:hypothetical protein